MSASTQLDSGVVGDAELIASARSGDAAAIGALYERHAGAAWVVARQYSDSPEDADDVVADSFTAVFGAIERGNGPEAAFRAYLFTVVRRVAGLRREKNRRVQPTDDIAVLEAGTALAGTAEEPALAGFERGVVARAFHSLPERWQAVLWHTEVEGLTPAEIAPILGLTANGTAALAYRAREGLRQAYLQQHLQDPLDDGCRTVAGKLGAYVRGGLGSRETGQVEAHLEDCGTCRGLLLELGDVNHGMRAVIAPLVLGLVGLGALGVALPVGGGLAAGAAAAAAAGAGAGGAGAGGAGAGGVAAGGSTAAGATTATGTVTAVGAGAASGAAATGGVAAFLAAIPLGVAAAVVGAVAIAAVAAIAIANLVNPSEDPTAAAPAPTSSESTSSSPQPTSSASAVATPQPTDLPTPEPTDLLADDDVVQDDDDDVLQPSDRGDATADGPQDEETAPPAPVVPTPVVPTPPIVPEDPPPPPPPPPAPASVSIDVPSAGLTLEAGLGGQELVVGLLNSGGTAATDLSADVTLPDGVTLDGIAAAALEGIGGGGFAVSTAAGWLCVVGDGANIASCTLDTLPALSTSTLVLRVSIDEAFDRADGEIGLHVHGAGIDYVAPPIPLAIAPSPARLALRSVPATLPLVNGRTRQLDLPVANMGGTAIAAGAATVTAHLPTGVTGTAAPGSAWACTGAGTLTCSSSAVGARTDAPLSLLLSSATAGVPASGLLAVELAPYGRLASHTVTVPFTVQRPAALGISGPGTATVAVGSPASVPLSVSNTGDLPAQGVTVTLSRPEGVAFGSPAVVPGAWTCSDGSATTVQCTTDAIDPGAALDLPVGLDAVTGQFGAIGTVTASAQAPDADAAPAFGIAVDALTPVLTLDEDDPQVWLGQGGTGTARFTVGASAADAESTRATLRLPLNLRADLATTASPSNACVAPDPRTVSCDLGTVPAGETVQVLVGVRSAGSARGTVTVAVEAVGASTQSSSSAQTSSGGLDVRDSFTGADVTEIGAPLLTCPRTVTTCASAIEKGDRDNNSFAMVPLDEASPAPTGPRSSVPVSSTANLVVPDGREILFAGLYWSANAGPRDTWSGPLTSARLRGPGGSFTEVTGDVVSEPTDNANRRYYQSFADVTDLVSDGGSGGWSVADIAVSATATDAERTYYAGWSLVVVFSDPASDASVTVYDGGQWIGSAALPVAFEFAADAGTTARIGVVAWEGDRTGTGDSLFLGDTCLGTPDAPVQRALVPTRRGGYDGSASNAFDSTATGWRATNSLGTDAKAFRPVRLACDVSSLTAVTAGDQFLIGAITLRSEPVPEIPSEPQG
ncbi:sigma-70 family RNA polymerase sigma factor [Cellulomonas xylanilytica]|uniref:RNA polymerase sigma-70 region 2 domain-containing protein n=1 Tax=Cellulomonas xylanilytica TaxID=233583 RepID=A0A510V0Q7_9CELL|nr:sigma-70 family RNA polymerase sigma factor [Cellulomonas xylanilytica]GEK20498.1 hypothetical protein CXY01_10180 [Cellulomonas xylanilytica]